MTSLDWTVLALGVSAIAWVNWYFFVAGRTPATAGVGSSARAAGPGDTATPEIIITVDGGYSPNTIRVRAGERTRLLFDRRDTSSCSEEVVFPDFGIRKYLPTAARTAIEVTAPAPGRYGFMCGMSMLRGTLIAD